MDRPHGLTPRAWSALLAGFLLVLAAWPVCFGWRVAHALETSVFLALFVWLPGRALLGWTWCPADALARAFLSWAGGLALLSLWFTAGCMLGARGMIWALPPVAGLALALARSRRPNVALVLPSWRELALLAVVLALTLARTRPDSPDEWFLGYSGDDSFHAGNAAELRWRWPLGDPRLAGFSLRYHFLAYSLPAALGNVFDLPVREILFGLAKHQAPLLFSLGVFVAARAYGAGVWLAAGCALALALHVDMGRILKDWLGADWTQNADFSVGLYESITNSVGLCLLLGLTLLLPRLLDERERGWGAAALAAVFALAVGATKISVTPPLCAGFGLALVWKLVRGGGFDRRLAGIALGCGLAVAPLSLWLMIESDGYAEHGVFHWVPGFSQRSSGLEHQVVAQLGLTSDPAWLTLALMPFWLLCVFGAVGFGLLGWAIVRADRGSIESPFGWTVFAGLVPSCLLASPGNSQLFFGNVSIVCGALLGVLGIQRCLASRAVLPRALAWLAGVVLAVHVASVLFGPPMRASLPIARTGQPEQYFAALEWMRTNLPPDAVLLADDVRLGAGTWSERRMFHDTARFSPKQRGMWEPSSTGARMPPGRAYDDRAQAQRAFLAQPDAAGLAAIRALLGTQAPLYALRSRAVLEVRNKRFELDVPAREGPDPLAELCGEGPVFENGVAAVYRLP